MCFRKIYSKVEELKYLSINELIELLQVDIKYSDNIDCKAMYIRYIKPTIVIKSNLTSYDSNLAILHEIGHHLFNRGSWLLNQRTEENNANLFMCLYLLKNEIWECDFFDWHLINLGVTPSIARMFNERVYQYKLQVKYELAY